jgi:hypothetical protein
MKWEVEYTDEFNDWWETITEEEQIEVVAKVTLLEKHGPILPRPHSDVIVTSRHSNMKELRGTVIFKDHRSELRVLYAFDPERVALLLIGGDKTGNPNWYNENVPKADTIFDRRLAEIAVEEEERKRKALQEQRRTKKGKSHGKKVR